MHGRLRVVALGDSFTFGWGVDFEDTWPRVLEEELLERGLDVEVLNLGRPGADPARHAEIARQALPLLRPDLVVVAINQGDDLAQIMASLAAADASGADGGGEPIERSVAERMKAIIKATYPSLVAVRGSVLAGGRMEFDATGTWVDRVAELRSGLSAEEQERLRGLDDEEIGAKFDRGKFNPSLLAAGLQRPEGIRATLALESEEVAARSASLPNGFFVSEKMQESYRRMGFRVEASHLGTTSMDDATRRSASAVGVEIVTVTELFREEAAGRDLSFEFDGHSTAEGQRLFTALIAEFVQEVSGSGPGRARTCDLPIMRLQRDRAEYGENPRGQSTFAGFSPARLLVAREASRAPSTVLGARLRRRC
ncbi:MAG TPA: SGNH/GDSL hydrolase family protein, partial [Longimicrobiales bacterium]|nr:SGNH/GDSL hydrolase family protein [Longimicrobiales bacterium]